MLQLIKIAYSPISMALHDVGLKAAKMARAQWDGTKKIPRQMGRDWHH